jgi:hypothetical protein
MPHCRLIQIYTMNSIVSSTQVGFLNKLLAQKKVAKQVATFFSKYTFTLTLQVGTLDFL